MVKEARCLDNVSGGFLERREKRKMFETIKKLFTPVESIDAQQARAYMNEHAEGSFTLLDVRQPAEYKTAHIPGATLVPLPKLSDSYDQLDPEKPVIVY